MSCRDWQVFPPGPCRSRFPVLPDARSTPRGRVVVRERGERPGLDPDRGRGALRTG